MLLCRVPTRTAIAIPTSFTSCVFNSSRNTIISLTTRTSSYSTATAEPTIKITDYPAPHTGNIRILSLNRPQARNAISRQLLSDLRHNVAALHAEGSTGPTRAVVLTSESDACFCAGADLKERAGMSQQETADFLSSLRDTFSAIAALPIPTISAISSLALGGGLELALTTHLRVFASTATVGLPETRLAIIPGAGGTHRLPAVIGQNRARDLILTGRRVAGPEAYFLGLCNRLVETEGLKYDDEGQERQGWQTVARETVTAEAVRLASEICEGGPIAIKAALGAVEGCAGGQEVENSYYDLVVKTRDRDEALQAFREKRKPVFAGH